MLARDFCFWLQGAFELANMNSCSLLETRIIEAHLGLVFEHETMRGTRAFEFCAGLRGWFELNNTVRKLDETQTASIKKALNKVFLHEIDPSMGGPAVQKKLNNIHAAPYRPEPGDGLLRC